jgi:hypothetical protein
MILVAGILIVITKIIYSIGYIPHQAKGGRYMLELIGLIVVVWGIIYFLNNMV